MTGGGPYCWHFGSQNLRLFGPKPLGFSPVATDFNTCATDPLGAGAATCAAAGVTIPELITVATARVTNALLNLVFTVPAYWLSNFDFITRRGGRSRSRGRRQGL